MSINSPITRWQGAAVLAVLGLSALLAATAARKNSVTVDEFADLPRGIRVWRDHVFNVESGTTPLPSMLAALPVVLFSDAKLGAKKGTGTFCPNGPAAAAHKRPQSPSPPPISAPPAQPKTVWTDGARFAAENRAHYQEYFLLGRSVTIFVLAATALLAWGFARSLYGRVGGLMALSIVCLSPDMLAHGSLVTSDVYLAAGVIGSLWALDAFLRKPGWRSALLLGAAMGVASLCKFTGVLLVIFFPAAALLAAMIQRAGWRALKRAAGWGTAALAVMVLAINLGYGFDRSFTPLGALPFQTRWPCAIQCLLPAWLPVPLPYAFVAGFDAQLSEATYDAYLLGTFNQTGFRDYYLVGFLVKTPEPILLLFLAALALGRWPTPREIPLLAVGVLLFCFFSFAGYKNIGIRYLLFLIPMAAVWIGRLAGGRDKGTGRPGDEEPDKSRPAAESAGLLVSWSPPLPCAVRSRLSAMLRAGGIVAAYVWLAWLALGACPDYLAYFNRLSGGSSRGHEYLLDSNLDWGQGLIGLRNYMRQAGIESIDLACFGRVDPAIYGIRYRPLLDAIGRGRYVAVSANLLWGRSYFVGGTEFWPPDRDWYAPFRGLRPKAVVGHCLYVFDLLAQAPGAMRVYFWAVPLNPDDAQMNNDLARLLAVVQPDHGGDPVRAVILARRACELTKGSSAEYLDTLAAAYAAGGRFAEAIATAGKAGRLARSTGQTALARQIDGRLQGYKERRACRGP